MWQDVIGHKISCRLNLLTTLHCHFNYSLTSLTPVFYLAHFSKVNYISCFSCLIKVYITSLFTHGQKHSCSVICGGMSFRVFSVNFCEGFITKFGDEFSKSPNLVNNPSLNLVMNLWLTESGEKSITKFGDEFVGHRILWFNWWISLWQTYHAFPWWLLWKILCCL